MGMTLADIEPHELWPDNLPAFNVLVSMATQWRIGPNGPYGLDYAALPAVWPLAGVDEADRTSVFADLRSMEQAALDEMRNK